MHLLLLALSLAALLCGAVIGTCSSAGAAETATTPMLNHDDAAFIGGALADELITVRVHDLGLKRPLSAAEREFSVRLAEEHATLREELQGIAKTKNVVQTTRLEDKAERRIDDLGKKADADFPAAYLGALIDAHKNAVSTFKDASEGAKDLDVKTFAAKYLARLQMHLEQLRDLAKKR